MTISNDSNTSISVVLKEDGNMWLAPHGEFEDYTLKFYDDVDQMMDEIQRYY